MKIWMGRTQQWNNLLQKWRWRMMIQVDGKNYGVIMPSKIQATWAWKNIIAIFQNGHKGEKLVGILTKVFKFELIGGNA